MSVKYKKIRVIMFSLLSVALICLMFPKSYVNAEENEVN